jgi:hypothetical protein
MSKRVIVCVVVMLLAVGIMVQAQAPAGPPKPGPEHKRLSMYAGKWNGAGEMKPSPWGPGGKMTSKETCTWFEGGFALVCNNEGAGAMGKMKGLSILTYKPEDKTYVYMAVNSIGEVEVSKGSVKGKTWTWTSESKMAGKTYKNRFTIVEESNDAYNYKFEMSADGKKWDLAMEGKSTRAK